MTEKGYNMPKLTAHYNIHKSPSKLELQSGTYTLSKLGNEGIAYTVDGSLLDYDSGTPLTDDIEVTVSEYIYFVSNKNYVPIEIGTDDLSVVFGNFPTYEEAQDQRTEENSTQIKHLTNVFKNDEPFINYSTVLDQNIVIGEEAKGVDGAVNGGGVAIGYGALLNNEREITDVSDESRFNTAVGSYSLHSNEKGNHNTAIGYQSGKQNINGSDNTYVGENAGFFASRGDGNTLIGTRARQGGTGGSNNTVLGRAAMYNQFWGGDTSPTGQDNVAIGVFAGATAEGDNYCTFLGARSFKDESQKGVQIVNSSAIGSNSRVTKSNEIVLGDENVDTIKMGGAQRTISTSTETGKAGEACWDTDYIYVCVATDTWKRTAISTW